MGCGDHLLTAHYLDQHLNLWWGSALTDPQKKSKYLITENVMNFHCIWAYYRGPLTSLIPSSQCSFRMLFHMLKNYAELEKDAQGFLGQW